MLVLLSLAAIGVAAFSWVIVHVATRPMHLSSSELAALRRRQERGA